MKQWILEGATKIGTTKISTSFFHATSVAVSSPRRTVSAQEITLAARKGASLLSDGLVASFVGGVTRADDGGERGLV
jgi:hypothetical protein